MAESYIQVAPDSTGKLIDAVSVTMPDATTQYRQAVALGDASAAGQFANVGIDGRLAVKEPTLAELLTSILVELRVLNMQIQSPLSVKDDLDKVRNEIFI